MSDGADPGEQDPGEQGPSGGPFHDEAAGDQVRDEIDGRDPAERPPIEHDPQGLDLARQIARSVTSGGSRPRRRRAPRPRQVDPQSSGAHPDDRDPQLMKDALGNLMGHLGWSRELNVHLLLARWSEFVGREIADHSTPEHFGDTVLTIRADSTAWAVELRRHYAPQLLARLTAELGDGSVTRLVIKGPDAPTWSHGRRSVRGRGPRDTYG